MRLTSFSITLLVIAILGCNTEPTPEMIEELASEGEKSLPKLYKIAARADLKPLFPTDWEFDPTVAAMSAIADMGPAGTPFLLDLLPLKGEKRQLFVFRIFLENLQDAHNPTKRLAGDDRALLALIYSAIVDTVGRVDKVILLDNYLVLHKKAKLRNDLDLSLIDMSLWCLENRGKLPEYILPKQWPKAIVLRTLVNQVENDPDYAANYSDLLDKTLKEVGVSREKVEQEQEKPTQAAVPLEEPSQALPARKGLPEELKVEINKQLEAMASDNYKEREEATSNLYRLLKESAGMQEAMIAYLEKRTRMIVDLEVQTRIERLLVRCLYPWKYFRPIRTIVLKSGDSELPPGIRHFTSAVSDFSFSSDGKLLAVALSREKTVKIFNVHTGECLKTLEGHRTFTPTVAFSPDDKLLASGSDDSTVKIWDPHTGKCLRTLKGHRTHVTDVAFSPDGRILVSASEDKTIRVWDTRNWKCLHVLKGHRGYVCSISFSPDSKLLASGGYATTDSCTQNRIDIQTAMNRAYDDSAIRGHGRYPSTIDSLVILGYLDTMPACPSNGKYLVNEGKVFCSVHGLLINPAKE